MFHLSALINANSRTAGGEWTETLRRFVRRLPAVALWLGLQLFPALPAAAVVLWNHSDTILAHETGAGSDILGGAIKRDDSANDTLYFRFRVNPISDRDTEEYFAALELYEGDLERLGVGNALKAYAYSAFVNTGESSESNQIASYLDLRTARPDASGGGALQRPLRGVSVTIVCKIQFVPGEDDIVTVWLNPDLGPGATEVYQPENLTTRFNANASFDELRLRHGGNGGGWNFSELAVATSFSDFVDVSSAQPAGAAHNAARGALAFSFRAWQKEQGLPPGPVRALAQTRDGYLWAGGGDGVARFDGLRFVTLGTREGLNNGPVRALLGDRRGALWIGGERGLSHWQNGQITAYTKRTGLPSEAITALAEDHQGRVWVGTEAGLARWQDGRLAGVSGEFAGKTITTLFNDRTGTLWAGVKGAGVFQLRGDQFTPVTDDSVKESLRDPLCLLVDQAGRVWIGAGDDSVLCWEEGLWRRHRIPRQLARQSVNALAEEPDGTIRAGSAGGGLLQFKDGKLSASPASAGLSGNLIEALLTDREGRLWVGTDSGLNLLRRKNLFALGQNEGLGFGAVQGLAEVAPGVIWAAKPNDGLYRWDGRSFNRLTASGLAPRDSPTIALLVARDGVCWVAGANGLLRYKDPIAAADEGRLFELPGANILSLAEDSGGDLWAGTREGKIWRLHEGSWVAQNDFPPTNAVTALRPEADGGMWIGTEGAGLFRFTNGEFQHWTTRDGLAGSSIRALHLGGQGALWIGTADGGLSRWRDGHIASFTTREGLPDNSVSQILEDDTGRLWLGTSRGIAAVSKHQLGELAAGKITNLFPQLYGRAEGMLSEECNGGFFPAGLKASSGQLWFSTAKGAVVVAPQTQSAASPPPAVMLEEILVDGIPAPDFRAADTAAAPPKLRITPGKHRLELRYTGLNFDAPESVRFRYRLEGLDTDWVEAGTRRAAFYSYVPPGDYRFRVIACNSDGAWTETGAALALTVARHFWQAWWFLGLAGLGLLIAVGVTVRVVEKRKIQRRLKRLVQERALERERTRIAQDLHDEMGAKLCRISFLSEHARSGDLQPGELENQIASISDASRDVLQSLDEIVWAVNPQNDTLEHVASYIGQYAQEYFALTGIGCELDIPAQLPPHPLTSQMRHHLFLAAHEAMTNILKHSGATRATISMTCHATTFEIAVADNGKGFDASVAPKTASPAAATGDGLHNMRRRLADIGGQCQVESAPGCGTTVRFVLPLDRRTKEI